MKRMLMCLMVLGTVLCVMGTAHAVTFVDTVNFSGINLSGTGVYPWSHATPTALNVPYDTVNSATIEVFATGVNGNNDMVRVGTLSGTLQNESLDFSWSEGLHLDGTTLNVAPVLSPWVGGTPLNVSLSYNEPLSFFGDWTPIHLCSSVLTIDYDNGTAPSAVPEPATMVLLGTGLVGLLGLKRKK